MMDGENKGRIEALIDAQDDPKSRGACMVLLRLIEDLERELRERERG